MPPAEELPTYCNKCGRNLDARYQPAYAVYNLTCRHCPDVHLQIPMQEALHRPPSQQMTLRKMVERTADASGVSAMQVPLGHAAPGGIIQGPVHITLPEGANAESFQQLLLEEMERFTYTPLNLSAREEAWLEMERFSLLELCGVQRWSDLDTHLVQMLGILPQELGVVDNKNIADCGYGR